ncbi:MAG: cbb3-type cytochrome c oxidase subunit I [Acidiferrobacterales bacterium]
MAEPVSAIAHEDAHYGELGFWSKYVFPTDHKMIAMQYMFTGMAMALIGGFMAYAFRMQLAFPGVDVPGYGTVTAANYNALITNHGTIMIFWVAMPVLIAAFGNFLIPLMIGCDDMVFPKINRLSYQIFLLSAIVLIVSFFVPGYLGNRSCVALAPASLQSSSIPAVVLHPCSRPVSLQSSSIPGIVPTARSVVGST